MTTRKLFFCCALCAMVLNEAGSAAAKDSDPFAPVAEAVRQRTRREVGWAQDLAACEQARAQAHTLLRQPLTLVGAVQAALLGNRALQASFEEIGLAYADVREARTLPNPQADLEVKLPDRAPTGPLYEWGVAQNFLSLLMIPLRSRVARAGLAAAQQSAADAVVTLVSEVKIAYFAVQADEAILTQLRLMQEGQSASLQLTQNLHAAGNVPDLNLVREQGAYDQGRLQLAVAEADAREHREKLSRLLGVWGADADWKLAGGLPPVPDTLPTVRGLESLAVTHRSDLAAARTRLESAVHALGLEKTFRFVGALDFGLAGETDPDKTNLTGPSIRLELPIFNQGQARLARGAAQLRLAQNRFEDLAIEIRSAVREKRDRLLSKRDIARFYQEEILPNRRRLTALTLLQYNAMLIGAFDAFQARRDAVDAERGLIEATRDYWIARAELEREVGGDLNPSASHPL